MPPTATPIRPPVNSSIMASRSVPFANYDISRSARETLGWRDSDGDGIFDRSGRAPPTLGGHHVRCRHPNRSIRRQLSVRALNNLNTSGTGNDITLNRVTGLQYRVDGGTWQDLAAADDYNVAFDATTPRYPRIRRYLSSYHRPPHRSGQQHALPGLHRSAAECRRSAGRQWRQLRLPD